MMRATRSFVAEYDGKEVQITAGRDLVVDDHPIRRAHPDAFEPEERAYERVREAAKNPGSREAGATFDHPGTGEREQHDRNPRLQETRDGALRPLERHSNDERLR
jgi:hypothetical protein